LCIALQSFIDMEAQLSVIFFCCDLLKDRKYQRIRGSVVRQHGDRLTAHQDALILRDSLQQKWDGIDRVWTILAAFAGQRVHGPHANLALWIAKQRDQRTDLPASTEGMTSPVLPDSFRANTKNPLPAAAATYCVPSTA